MNRFSLLVQTHKSIAKAELLNRSWQNQFVQVWIFVCIRHMCFEGSAELWSERKSFQTSGIDACGGKTFEFSESKRVKVSLQADAFVPRIKSHNPLRYAYDFVLVMFLHKNSIPRQLRNEAFVTNLAPHKGCLCEKLRYFSLQHWFDRIWCFIVCEQEDRIITRLMFAADDSCSRFHKQMFALFPRHALRWLAFHFSTRLSTGSW